MKKAILAIGVAAVLTAFSIEGFTAYAAVDQEACDLCFQTTANELLDEDEVSGTVIAAERKPLYDLNLEQMGCVYEFEVLSGTGFAIVICNEGEYIAQEFATSSVSPYENAEGLCVYVNTALYLEYADGVYSEISSSAALADEDVERLKDDAILYHTDVATPEYKTVYIYYTNRTKVSNALCLYYPEYCNLSGLVGACAAVAGTNLVGYYDRFYEDLIPNHEAGRTILGTYYAYNYQDSYVDAAMQELYADMGGNGQGITGTNFMNGMKTYCAKRNRTCTFTTIVSSGKINYDSVKTCIDTGYPIALLLSSYTITDNHTFDTYDAFNYMLFTGTHIMAGFSYRDITYTLSNGTKQNCRLIGVATGFGNPSTAYYNLDYNTNVVNAYKVDIH